jgi:hypothetical protein
MLGCDKVSLRNGTYKAYLGFYYRHNRDAEWFRGVVMRALPNATNVECGEVWKAFNGGATVDRQSHWWATFNLPKEDSK